MIHGDNVSVHVGVDNWRAVRSVGMRECSEESVADESLGPCVVVYEEGEGGGVKEVE